MTETHSDAAIIDPPHPTSSLLSGSVGRQIFWLALPVLAEQLLNYTVGLTDAYLSGRISKEATAAVGIGAYVNWLVEILFAVVGTGTGALVARHWGVGDRQAASRVASCSLALAIVLGIVATVAMFAAAPVFGPLLNLKPDVDAIATRFLRISCVGYLSSSICLIGGAALRGAGVMRVPLLVLGLVSVLNVIFSASLAYGVGPIPAWGVDGISTGTVLARTVGGVLMLVVLASRWGELRAVPSRGSLLDFATMRRILKIGAPAACDGLLMWSGHMLFVRIIAGLGSGDQENAALAAHIVFIEVEAVTYMPAWAWGTASATLIGQCLGAGLPDRARRGAHLAMAQAALLAACVSVVFYFGSATIYGWMHTDPAVGAVGAPALSALALMEIPLAIAIVYTVSVRGSGDTFAPLVINAACVFGVRLTVGYVCTHFYNGGLLGAWFGMAVDVTVRAILISCYFRWGRWSKTVV